MVITLNTLQIYNSGVRRCRDVALIILLTSNISELQIFFRRTNLYEATTSSLFEGTVFPRYIWNRIWAMYKTIPVAKCEVIT